MAVINFSCRQLSSRLDFCFVTHYHKTELLVRLSCTLMLPRRKRYLYMLIRISFKKLLHRLFIRVNEIPNTLYIFISTCFIIIILLLFFTSYEKTIQHFLQGYTIMLCNYGLCISFVCRHLNNLIHLCICVCGVKVVVQRRPANFWVACSSSTGSDEPYL